MAKTPENKPQEQYYNKFNKDQKKKKMAHIKKDKTKPAAQTGMSEVGSDPRPAFFPMPHFPSPHDSMTLGK